MKFRITMKDPDGVFECIDEAVKRDLAAVLSLSDEERETLRETRTETVKRVTRKWFEYDEYLCVEIDTDAGTATIVEIKR